MPTIDPRAAAQRPCEETPRQPKRLGSKEAASGSGGGGGPPLCSVVCLFDRLVFSQYSSLRKGSVSRLEVLDAQLEQVSIPSHPIPIPRTMALALRRSVTACALRVAAAACLLVCLFACLLACLFVCLLVCLFARLFARLFVCLVVLLDGLCATTGRAGEGGGAAAGDTRVDLQVGRAAQGAKAQAQIRARACDSRLRARLRARIKPLHTQAGAK